MTYKQRKLWQRAVTLYSKAKQLEQDIAQYIGPDFGDTDTWNAAANVADAASELEVLLERKELR